MKKYNKMYQEVMVDDGGGGAVTLTEKVNFDPDQMAVVSEELKKDITDLATAISDIDTAIANIKTGLGEGDIQTAVEATYSKYKADIDAGKAAVDSINTNLDSIIENNKNTSAKIAAALSALEGGDSSEGDAA